MSTRLLACDDQNYSDLIARRETRHDPHQGAVQKQHQLDGEPFGTLAKAIAKAWETIPVECRDSSGFDLSTLTVWYHRPETEEDKRERAEYERLKEKFDKIRYD